MAKIGTWFLVFSFYKELGVLDVLMAESLSLLHGLLLFFDRGVPHLMVEVDSEALVRLWHLGVVAKWPLCNILTRIQIGRESCREQV